MHRRNRHINASAAGAVIVLDSRYLQGLSNGNNVSSWTNRNTSVGNSPTQATANNQPVYTTNVQGGNPGLLFDNAASASGRYLTFSSSPISSATAASAIYSFRRTGIDTYPSAIVANFGTNNNNDHEPWIDGNMYSSFASDLRKTVSNYSTTVPNNSDKIQYTESATNLWRVFINSINLYTTTTNTVAIGTVPRIGGDGGLRPSGGGNAAFLWTGYIYSIMIFKNILSDSLRKRFERSIGYSFKIQTN